MSAAISLERSPHVATLSLDAIRLVTELQPRFEIDRSLLDDYTAAVSDGAVFPPVVVFRDGDDYLLADGYHRWHTHRALGLADIKAEVRVGGFRDALRFSLAANSAHGKRRQPDDYKRAYGIATSNGLVAAADVDGVVELLRCSIRWAQVLTQEARAEEQRRRDAEIAAKAAEGKSNRQIAREVGMSDMGVGKVLARAANETQSAGSLQSEPPTTLASSEISQLPFRAHAREWTDSETDRKTRAEAGECVVASMRGEIDTALLQWAEANDRYVRIDRRTEWGNPFEIPDDGERADVIAKFASFYLPHKDGLLAKLGSLRGKVLGCWCHPEQCHGHVLAAVANRAAEGEPLPEILETLHCEGCA